MKKMIFLLTIFLFSTFTFSSCSKGASEGPDTPSYTVKPISYGNGVYYFAASEAAFGVALSDFLADTSKHVIAITGGNTDTYGSIAGYFVVVKK
jgi:hypothetical protein